MNQHCKYWTDQLKKLNGGLIENPIMSQPEGEWDESVFFGLEIKMPNGETKLLWILRDEEANGPGSFEVVDNYKSNGIKHIKD